MLGTLIVILVVSWLLIRSSGFQTYLVNKLTGILEDKFGGQISIGRLYVKYPSKVIAENVLLRDELGDTLCYLKEISAGINHYSIKDRVFELGRIRILDPYIQLLEDPGGGNNYDFFIEMVSSSDTVPSPVYFSGNLITVRNARVRQKKFGTVPVTGAFSTDNFEISGLNMNLANFGYNPDSLSFFVSSLELRERSGFTLKESSGFFMINSEKIKVVDFVLETTESIVKVPLAQYFIHAENKELPFVNRLDMELKIDRSTEIRQSDIEYFIPDVQGQNDLFGIYGDIKLNRGIWKLTNATVSAADWLRLEGDIEINGAADLLKAGYNAHIDTLWFDPDKAGKSIMALFIDLDTVSLPFDPSVLGKVYFQGDLHGKYKNFIAEGTLRSGAGAFSGGLSVKPSEEFGMFDVLANYRISLIHLDNFLDTQTGIGLISANGSLKGSWDGENEYAFHLESILPFIQWRGYYYSNVSLNSYLENGLYETALNFNDEAGSLEFSGKFDFRQEKPVFDFDVMIGNADLVKLNLYPYDSVAKLDLNLHASFSGKEMDDIEGQLWIIDSHFINSRGEIPIKELSLESVMEMNRKKINLESEYIDGRIIGDIYLDDLITQLKAIGGRFMPAQFEQVQVNNDRLNNFSFNLHFKNPRPLAEVLASDFIFKENTQLSGFFRNGGREIEIEGNSPQFLLSRKLFTDLRFRLSALGSYMNFEAVMAKVQFDQNNSFEDIDIKANILPDSIGVVVSWKGDLLDYQSILKPSVSFEPGRKTMPSIIVDLPPSAVFYKEQKWDISESRFQFDYRYFSLENLLIKSGNEEVRISGAISDNEADTLGLKFNALDMGIINQFTGKSGLELSGLINGETKFFNFYNGGLFLADIFINEFVVNGETIGNTEIKSRRADEGDDILINVLTRRGEISTLQMDGNYSPSDDKLDFLFHLDKLRLNVFDPFLYPVLSDVKGIATGDVQITGTRQKPLLSGIINVQRGGIKVDYLNTSYNFTHPIIVSDNAFLVEGLVARDSLGNTAIVNGGVRHNGFRDIRLDFRINANNSLLMNTEEYNGDGYWGTAFATGFASIQGPLKKIKIDVAARTSPGTKFSIPVNSQGKARTVDFITYVVHPDPDEDLDLITFDVSGGKKGYNANPNKLELALDIEVTPDAEAFLIFDAKVGDVMKGRGIGNLQINVNTLGLFTLNGDFVIDEGEYLFTLQNMPIKRFAIEQGSTIKWTGEVEKAQLNIDAVYTTKAALYDLLLEESDELTERVPVTCHLYMQGVLENPDLSFGITLPPGSNDMARSQLESLTEDERNKQLFSLLILNRFQPLPGLSSGTSSRSYGNTGLATTTEVLSSQLNYWLSQISQDFDIGLNYRPGDQITSDEVEVALSTQIFNNRMTINLNGNVDMRSSQDETNQLVGDVEVEYKIKPSGRIRVKAFNRSNDRLIYEYSPYTQGLGLFFRQEFDSLGDLFRKYSSKTTGKEIESNR